MVAMAWEDSTWSVVKKILVHQGLSRLGRTLYEDICRMENLISSLPCAWIVLRPLGLVTISHPTECKVSENHISGDETAGRDLVSVALDAVIDEKWIQQKVAVATVTGSMSLKGSSGGRVLDLNCRDKTWTGASHCRRG